MWEEVKWGLAKSVLLSVLVLGPFIYHSAYDGVNNVTGGPTGVHMVMK